MSKSLRVLVGTLSASALLLVAGCGAGTQSPESEPGQLRVVTALYPFQFVSERVAGASAQVSNLVAPGSDPHDLELSPRQLIEIAEADVIVYQSGFQPAVDEAVAQNAPDLVVDVADLVTLQEVPGHAHDEEEHTEPAHAEEGHDHGLEEAGLDPHTWLDTDNMAAVATGVADALATAAPEQAATVRSNAEALQQELHTLDQDFAAGLETCERREFITSHAAFGYLATRYDLEQIGISGISPDAEPSPARIAAIHAEAEEHGITTIFTETLVSPAVAEAIAGDLGLTTDVLDPIEGLTEQSRGSDYIAVQRANLEALRTANGCS
ncbi:zinc ABC transporter substrate-binding protein [Desertihabitans brevis]|uniref:Zinc ABC transporter substrate-binding protein n=1 Tax=Desertihabitans brevis TaxID=2268447 RepID=A0A367YU95_9ACTN|nr:metal ABC transporter substrate-binding protein [Desertihabitans brevis]RCK69388.1 zinc ABC transporter substrate-binding protein [Desertihabitans brevis]